MSDHCKLKPSVSTVQCILILVLKFITVVQVLVLPCEFNDFIKEKSEDTEQTVFHSISDLLKLLILNTRKKFKFMHLNLYQASQQLMDNLLKTHT